jgi:uncharacterized protein (TIGR02678 family)
MTSGTGTGAAGPLNSARDAQRAFTGLLARPLVTPASDPVLHRAVTRNARAVGSSARRLGYRVATIGRAIRLVRVPLAGTVTAPPPPLDRPDRRVLALACGLAAVCEDTTGGATLARLSRLVQELSTSTASTISPYDQSLLAHRRQLLRAARLLEHWGVLRRRTAEDRLLENWAEGGGGIGAGYEIDREALLLLTSPDVLAAALDRPPAAADQVSSSAPLRALRALVETPAVLYHELSEADAQLLRSTRGLRSSEAVAMTGGHVETRAEGLILIVDDVPPSPVTLDWPRASTQSGAALLMADAASRAGQRQPDGTVRLASYEVDELVRQLHAAHKDYLTKAMQEDPSQLREAAQSQLAYLGLLRVLPAGGWVLSPVAGRYRDPGLVRSGPGDALAGPGAEPEAGY